jgi:hypothetical protein
VSIVTRQDTATFGKRVQVDQETWNALDLLVMESCRVDEAFDPKTALPRSVGNIEKSERRVDHAFDRADAYHVGFCRADLFGPSSVLV